MEPKKLEKYIESKGKVDRIKGFYRHLIIYLFANILLFVFKGYAYDYFGSQGIEDRGFLDWFELNLVLTPLIWGLGLLTHGLIVYRFTSFPLKDIKPKILREWEARQIKKYIEKDTE